VSDDRTNTSPHPIELVHGDWPDYSVLLPASIPNSLEMIDIDQWATKHCP